jgi:hypothetical protein
VTENLRGVCRNGDPEDKIDEERAERLASTITLGQWNITPDRPPFDRREVGTSRQNNRVLLDRINRRKRVMLTVTGPPTEFVIRICVVDIEAAVAELR